MKELTLRKGTEQDVATAFALVKELAVYEKALHEVETSEEQLTKAFKENLYQFFVAETENTIVGLALFFNYYSTWKGKSIYLEDLVVKESYRRQGIGQKLLDTVIDHAKNNGYQNVLWQVLDWNTSAIQFYEKKGAKLNSEWVNCRLVVNKAAQ